MRVDRTFAGQRREPVRTEYPLRGLEQYFLFEMDMGLEQFGESGQVVDTILGNQTSHRFVLRQGAFDQLVLPDLAQRRQKALLLATEVGLEFVVKARPEFPPGGRLCCGVIPGRAKRPSGENEPEVVITGQIAQRRISLH